MSDLKTAIAQVEVIIADWGAATEGTSPTRDYDEWRRVRRAAEDDAMAKLLRAGAIICDGTGSVVAIRLWGLRSTSTCGLNGAVHNWLRLAATKLGEKTDG